MLHYRHLTIAFAVGAVLAIICVYLSGLIAALPMPGPLSVFAQGHVSLALIALDLLGEVPIALLSWLAGWLLFRAFGTRSTMLWVAISPWVIYGIDGIWRYIQLCGAQIWASPALLSGWVFSLLSVPAGLWLALRYARSKATVFP